MLDAGRSHLFDAPHLTLVPRPGDRAAGRWASTSRVTRCAIGSTRARRDTSARSIRSRVRSVAASRVARVAACDRPREHGARAGGVAGQPAGPRQHSERRRVRVAGVDGAIEVRRGGVRIAGPKRQGADAPRACRADARRRRCRLEGVEVDERVARHEVVREPLGDVGEILKRFEIDGRRRDRFAQQPLGAGQVAGEEQRPAVQREAFAAPAPCRRARVRGRQRARRSTSRSRVRSARARWTRPMASCTRESCRRGGSRRPTSVPSAPSNWPCRASASAIATRRVDAGCRGPRAPAAAASRPRRGPRRGTGRRVLRGRRSAPARSGPPARARRSPRRVAARRDRPGRAGSALRRSCRVRAMASLQRSRRPRPATPAR